MLGLGSVLGTGIFVSIGTAAAEVGSWAVLAVLVAGLVATFNGLSSAQLAARHPVSGGTYEYGYRELTPLLGFSAGWMFLCAKSASAAAAAAGFAAATLAAFDVNSEQARTWVGLGVVVVMTIVVAAGVRRTNLVNTIIVSTTLVALGAFLVGGFAHQIGRDDSMHGNAPLVGNPPFDLHAFLHAAAILFVAYTGYGRIATLGEEIRDPERSIPRALIITLCVTAALYAAVAHVAVSAVGGRELGELTRQTASPLQRIARDFGVAGLDRLVAVGAASAMLGVLLNLLLGISRVVLAMARRGDMPNALAAVDVTRSTPRRAVVAVGIGIAALVVLGDLGRNWSFSAFTVLIYYAITNLAALRLPAAERTLPHVVAAAGFTSCVGLAAFVEPSVMFWGVVVLAVGWLWHAVARSRARSAPRER
jgi:APA family basic amino acid/polyamine antiporter